MAMTTVEVEDAGPTLRYTVQLPGCTPERALQAFTSPQMLAQWWGNAELTAVLEPDGTYAVWFPGIPARMAGRVIRYEPASPKIGPVRGRRQCPVPVVAAGLECGLVRRLARG